VVEPNNAALAPSAVSTSVSTNLLGTLDLCRSDRDSDSHLLVVPLPNVKLERYLVQRVPSNDHSHVSTARSEPFYPAATDDIGVDIPNKHQFTMDPRTNTMLNLNRQHHASGSDSDNDDDDCGMDSSTDNSDLTDLLMDEDAHAHDDNVNVNANDGKANATSKEDFLSVIGDVHVVLKPKQPSKVKQMLKKPIITTTSGRITPDRSGMPLAPSSSNANASHTASNSNVFSLPLPLLPTGMAVTRDRTSSFASAVSAQSFEQFEHELDGHHAFQTQQDNTSSDDDSDVDVDVDDNVGDAHDADNVNADGADDNASFCGTYDGVDVDDNDSDVGAPANRAAKRALRQTQKQQRLKAAREKLEMTPPRAPRPKYVPGGGSVGHGLGGSGSQGASLLSQAGQLGAVPKSIVQNRNLSNRARMRLAKPKLTSSKSLTAAVPNQNKAQVPAVAMVGRHSNSNSNTTSKSSINTSKNVNVTKKSNSKAVPSQGQAQEQESMRRTKNNNNNNNDDEESDDEEEIPLMVDDFDFDKYNTNSNANSNANANANTAAYSQSEPSQSQNNAQAHANPPHPASVVMEYSPHTTARYDHAGAPYGTHGAYPGGAYPPPYGHPHQHPYPHYNGEPHGHGQQHGHPYAPAPYNPYDPPPLPQPFGAYPGPGPGPDQPHMMGALGQGQYPHAHAHGQGYPHPHPHQPYPPHTYYGPQGQGGAGAGGYSHAPPYAAGPPPPIGGIGIPFSSTYTSNVTGASSSGVGPEPGPGAGIPTTTKQQIMGNNKIHNNNSNSETEPLVPQTVMMFPPSANANANANAGTTATTTAADDSIPSLPPPPSGGTLMYPPPEHGFGHGHELHPQGYGATDNDTVNVNVNGNADVDVNGMPMQYYPGSGRPPYYGSGSGYHPHPHTHLAPSHLYGGVPSRDSSGALSAVGAAAGAPANGTGTALLRRRSSLAEFVHRPKQVFDEQVDSVFSSMRSLSEADEEWVNQDAQKYLASSAVSRAFPERFVALCITLLVELPTLFMIYNGSSQLCGLLGRTKYQLLMAFLPLTSAISGNCGLQGSTLTTRAVSHGQVTKKNFARWLQQEVVASLLMGVGMALLLGMLAYYYTNYDWVFATTIAMAQILSNVTAGLTGTLAPLLFTFIFRRDSGKWGGPLETAIQDIVGSFAMVVLSYHFLVFVGPMEIEPHDMCTVAAAGGGGGEDGM
jgi:cation transporter-like permease